MGARGRLGCKSLILNRLRPEAKSQTIFDSTHAQGITFNVHEEVEKILCFSEVVVF